MESGYSNSDHSKTKIGSEPEVERLEFAHTINDDAPPSDFVVVANGPVDGIKLAKDGKVCPIH